jgi:cytochrome c
MPELRAILVVLALAAASHAGPDLGREATPAEIAAWSRSVAPDGRGLPAGSGSVAEGRQLYAVNCAHCHGQDGRGGLADPLVGGEGSLASDTPLLTVGSFWPYATTLFDYVRRAMPYDRPSSLSDDEVYAVSAYVLFLNGIVPEHARLDARTLPALRMPNRDGFIDASGTAR